ncbi:MAG: hypothetical protein FD146_447 [Anaerolineaceae bacterium]|nr:MAG: hypothetical protein FD146_447 [Anaerolineaceae bacterium]
MGVKKLFQRAIAWFQATFTDRTCRDLQRTWTGRAINAVSFMMVIVMLALWVTLFVILRDNLSSDSLAASTVTAVSCFAFFGGLLLAIVIGGWLGNALRRIFWKILVKLGK